MLLLFSKASLAGCESVGAGRELFKAERSLLGFEVFHFERMGEVADGPRIRNFSVYGRSSQGLLEVWKSLISSRELVEV